MLYFIVRTDVSKDAGVQRVFGAYDSEAEANREIVNIKAVRAGTYKIYKGRAID